MKRLNLKLLIGLLVALVVLTGASYGVWKYQMRRNSQNFIVWADEQREQGNYEKEAEFLWRYMLYDPDATEVEARYALVAADLGRNDARRTMSAINACLKVLRKDETNLEVRRALGDLYMRIRRTSDAITHLERVRAEQPDDAEVAEMLATCYLIDENTAAAEELLLEAIEANPKNVPLYQTLATRVYREGLKDNDKAMEIVNRMVEANPDSAEAYLRRFQLAMAINPQGSDQAKADIDRALELDPENHEVAVEAAQLALRDQDFDRARMLLANARKVHPDSQKLIVAQSQMERFTGNMEAAQRYLEEGLEALPKDRELMFLLADIHLRAGRTAEVRQLMKDLQEAGMQLEQVDLLRGLVLIQERKPAEALTVLNRIRPTMARSPQHLFQVDSARALCYRSLGQVDQEIGVLRNMLLADPIRGPRLELARALITSGRTEDGLRELEGLAEQGNSMAQLMMFQTLVNQNLRLPPEQRNWALADRLLDIIAPESAEEPRLIVMRVEYLTRKGELESALRILDDKQEKIDGEPMAWLARAEIANRQSGFDAALEALEQAQGKLRDKQEFRLARINLIAQQGNNEETKQALLDIEKEAAALPGEEKDVIDRALGQIFYALRDYSEAERFYKQVAARPENSKDLPLQVLIFSIQRDATNDEGVEQTLAKIKQIAPRGDRNEYYLFCRAAKTVSDVQRQKQPVSALAEARSDLEEATRERPNWAQAWRLRGEIEERSGNTDQAIVAFKRALDLGDTNPQMVKHLAALLLSKGQADEVQALMDQVPNGRAILGRRIEALVSLAQGDVVDAIPAAIESVEEDPNASHVTQIWLGEVLKAGGHFADAEKAYRRAIELAPDMPEGYVSLATFLGSQDRRSEVAELITEIEAHVGPEKRDLALAAAHEAAGDRDETEKYLLQVSEKDPKNAQVMEALASFYARTGQNDRMTEYLHKLANLQGADAPEQRAAVRQANRNLASLEANKNTVEGVTNAISILKRNADPDYDTTDLILAARFHTSLGDPKSREEAINFLRQALSREPERAQARMMLAQLLEQDDNWREAKDLMLGLVSSEKLRNDPTVLANYADMLLRHGEVEEATNYVRQLEQLNFDKHPVFVSLKARQLRDQGKPDEAIALLSSQIVRPLSPDGVNRLRELGDQLVAMSQDSPDAANYLNAAEEMYREFVEERPDAILVLASFKGQYRDLDAGFEICDEALESGMPPELVARLALSLLRTKPEQGTEKLHNQVEGWLQQSLDKDSDAVIPNLLLADFYDIVGDYSAAAKIYRKFTDRTDLALAERVTVLNNLAFIVATHEKNGDEALPLIEEAIKLIGPNPELLDTRGMAHLARGNVAEAISDLQSSLASGPNGVKYFHLALAHLAANNRDAAAEAFDQAREAGLSPATVPGMEIAEYERLEREFPARASAAN